VSGERQAALDLALTAIVAAGAVHRFGWLDGLGLVALCLLALRHFKPVRR
jgi:hypothetical protein